MMEFHISRAVRERYEFKESLFSYTGNVVFANIGACREFAYKMNQVRDAQHNPERTVHAGALYAMGLIDEASHMAIARYRQTLDPVVMTAALDWFGSKVGRQELDRLLLTFVEQFPGSAVMRGEATAQQWLAGTTEGVPHRAAALEELILLWAANRNPAFKPFEELFEDKPLAERTVYKRLTQQLPAYFATRPLVPLEDSAPVTLIDFLRAPAVGSPKSLAEQLSLIRRLWRPLLGDALDRLLMIAGEILREEELAIWLQFNPDALRAREAAERRRRRGQQQWPALASESQVPVFGDPAHEYERFSADTAWMPGAVLIAKSTYVWLAQLSRQHGRHIGRLDEIPDEELALLAHRGLNSLWLIGIWERSRASKTIKLLCGNTDAVASAYSLFDYRVADDLGGEGAYINLRDRAYRHGIRLASDMVPNHMGIDSPWVIEHPEWFISRRESPYPAYRFDGPNLSNDSRVELKIDDHYYEQTDAAVVFRRRDQATGDTHYIYHGNDGTSFPWNDTAQLDYLNPAVREQVIQTILHVARLFPVIRFDAAMTLAKRHFHRLWFPGPGTSGAIPSRAEYSMSDEEFNRAMPHEFWREVVDRVAAEVPGTLLLAEAFWLMEGYFVRTLGMHRVYNSAFMNMLRDEKNAEYRSVIKETLKFDPDIMKRYVNFMSNPDERTAIDQFGTGDKCFGVATMMSTLPGLPMFGHGQIEGFTEKYGMEYQRPRYEESPNQGLVERHERQIAPLLKHRWLFAESGNFLLYDFYRTRGAVDENVFAYSNRSGDHRALVVFHNRYASTHGTIDYSAASMDKGSGELRQRRLGEGLDFGGGTGRVLAFRDSLTGLEYLRRADDVAQRGLTLDLQAYQCHVFVDWHARESTSEYPWDRLCDELGGRGVPSLDEAMVMMELRPVHDAVRDQLDSQIVRHFGDVAEHPRGTGPGAEPAARQQRAEFLDQAWTRTARLIRAAQHAWRRGIGDGHRIVESAEMRRFEEMAQSSKDRFRAAMRIPALEALSPAPWSGAARKVLPSPSPQRTATAMWGPVLAWTALEMLAESIDAEKPEPVALELFDRLRLREPFARAFANLGFEGEESWRAAARIKVVLLTEAELAKRGPEEAAEKHIPNEQASGHGLSRADQGRSSSDSEPASAREGSPSEAAKPEFPPGLPANLWNDPDVRWLTGAHESDGIRYIVRESYEELLWWMLMPSLLRLAGESAPSRATVDGLSRTVKDALAAAEAAGYRIDALTNPAPARPLSSAEKQPTVRPAVVEEEESATGKPKG